MEISQNVLRLMQPELFSVEELVDILKERGVERNLSSQSKDELVSLFRNVAFPLPQRQFRNNYRGSLVNKMRQKRERKKVFENSVDEHKSFTVGVVEGVSSTKRSLVQNCDRLKPPPEIASSEKKKIRLSSSSQSSEGQSNSRTDLDKIVINQRRPSKSDDLVNKNENCINDTKPKLNRLSTNSNLDKSNGACQNSSSKNSTPKKISLKRNHLTSMSSVSSSECEPTEKSPIETDKKRKPITWP